MAGPFLVFYEPQHDKANKMSVPRLILVFAGRTLSLLVLSCRGSSVVWYLRFYLSLVPLTGIVITSGEGEEVW